MAWTFAARHVDQPCPIPQRRTSPTTLGGPSSPSLVVLLVVKERERRPTTERRRCDEMANEVPGRNQGHATRGCAVLPGRARHARGWSDRADDESEAAERICNGSADCVRRQLSVRVAASISWIANRHGFSRGQTSPHR